MSTLPQSLARLAAGARVVRAEEISRFLPPETGGRPAAVLMLFADGPDGPDVLLIERAATLRSHAGQPAFPGGAIDPGDDGPVGAALREAQEEVGIDPASVEIVAELPELFIPVTGFVVTPVLAWWREPHPVHPVDVQEVAAVVRVPIAELADPASRQRVRHPSGWVGPAFNVRGMLVWGFTAGLLDRLLKLGGWEQPWTPGRVNELPQPAKDNGV
ncbi:MAG TPA: CoA pyrophosphatase [Frankiaceae bacterium]|nr:CoA pyrophosphatase [Frankiaceae bacterium]